MYMLEKAGTMVDMRDQACLAGIEKLRKGPLFSSMEPILPLMKLQMQTTIAVCCLGNCYVPLWFTFIPEVVYMRIY